MGLFNFFKSRRFVDKSDLSRGIKKQSTMNAQTLSQLHNYGITKDSQLKLEFFFYTDKSQKAHNLAHDLKALSYHLETVDKSAGDDKLWVVSGWTNEING